MATLEPPAFARTTVRALRRSALVAGFGTLAMAVLAPIANFGAIQSQITKGEATRTAADILASEGWFRLGIVGLLGVVILDIVVAWALLTFFEPANQPIARLAAWMRICYAVVFAVAISQLVEALRLLGDDDYLTAFTADQRNSEALLKTQAFQDVWQVGLALFGLYLIILGYLAYTSGYVPWILGVLLVISGGGYLVDSLGGLLFANYSGTVAAFTFFGEPLFMLWLLVKGRSLTGEAVARRIH